MKIVKKDVDFYRVEQVPKNVFDYLLRSIQASARRYEDGGWWVHKDFVVQTIQLAVQTGTTVDFDALEPKLVQVVQAEYANWTAGSAADRKVPITTHRDPYSTLFLVPSAPDYVLEAVWKAIVRSAHPDRGGEPTKFLRYKDAYEKIKHNRKSKETKSN